MTALHIFVTILNFVFYSVKGIIAVIIDFYLFGEILVDRPIHYIIYVGLNFSSQNIIKSVHGKSIPSPTQLALNIIFVY